jgi:hypothetical protein
MRPVEFVFAVGWRVFWLYWSTPFYEEGSRPVVPRASYEGGCRCRRDPLGYASLYLMQ